MSKQEITHVKLLLAAQPGLLERLVEQFLNESDDPSLNAAVQRNDYTVAMFAGSGAMHSAKYAAVITWRDII